MAFPFGDWSPHLRTHRVEPQLLPEVLDEDATPLQQPVARLLGTHVDLNHLAADPDAEAQALPAGR